MAVAAPATALAAPFTWSAAHIAADLPHARVLFTTRRGGVSVAPYDSLNLGLLTDDRLEAVAANRARVAELVGLPRERFAQGRQVHAARVARVTTAPEPGADVAGRAAAPGLAAADGQATNVPGMAAVVLVADCLPIAVAGAGALAMLHGGWRGLAAGIVAEGVRAVRELGAAGPLAAAIGPGAGGCCFAVGSEVQERFAGVAGARRGANLDLRAVARAQLRAAGVGEVHDVGLCTLCAEPGLFFSHRRDGGVTGRQAGIAWSNSPAG